MVKKKDILVSAEVQLYGFTLKRTNNLIRILDKTSGLMRINTKKKESLRVMFQDLKS